MEEHQLFQLSHLLEVEVVQVKHQDLTQVEEVVQVAVENKIMVTMEQHHLVVL
jgi:hypothetical protein